MAQRTGHEECFAKGLNQNSDSRHREGGMVSREIYNTEIWRRETGLVYGKLETT